MKKLLAGILATTMSLACFAACDGGNSSVVYDVSKGADALFAKYDAEEIDSPRREDFTLVNTIVGSDGITYTVTWSIEDAADGVVTLTRGETNTTVDVNETLDEDATYTLKATVGAPDGTSKVETFYCTVEAAPSVVPVAITAKPAENTAYKLYVYQSNKSQDCYFAGMMDGYYFKTTEAAGEAVDVYVENVANSDLFNLYFTHVTDGKQYIGVEVSADGKHNNIVYKSTAPSSFSWNTDLETITTRIVDKDGKESDFYLGNYSTFTTISASTSDKASSSNVGGLVTLMNKNNLSPEYKIGQIKEVLNVQETHKLDKTVELPTADERYPDATIAWAVTGEGATLSDGNQLALTIPTTAATVTLTATISVGATNDTKTFTLTLGPVVTAPDATSAAAVVNAAFSLAENETLPGGNYTLTGVISKVNTAYSEEYSNVTVTITVEEKEIECYRLKGTGADVIKAGDTITVTGKIKNYNGKVEFDSGCTLDSYTAGQGGNQGGSGTNQAQTDIVDAAYALEEGQALDGTYTLTGVITSVDEAYSSQHNNVTVTFVVEGRETKPIKAYRLKGTGADEIAAGYTITVSGTLKNYYGTIEFDSGCTLDSFVYGEAPTVEGVTISFADKANRTEFDTAHQVWVQNGITVTNNKAASTSNVADYANPARFYKSSDLTIAYTGMTEIVIECNSAQYASALVASITDTSVTVTTFATSVTITFAQATNSWTIAALSAQVRINSITVSAN